MPEAAESANDAMIGIETGQWEMIALHHSAAGPPGKLVMLPGACTPPSPCTSERKGAYGVDRNYVELLSVPCRDAECSKVTETGQGA